MVQANMVENDHEDGVLFTASQTRSVVTCNPAFRAGKVHNICGNQSTSLSVDSRAGSTYRHMIQA